MGTENCTEPTGEHALNRDWAQGISNENGIRVERRDAQVESEGGRETEYVQHGGVEAALPM